LSLPSRFGGIDSCRYQAETDGHLKVHLDQHLRENAKDQNRQPALNPYPCLHANPSQYRLSPLNGSRIARSRFLPSYSAASKPQHDCGVAHLPAGMLGKFGGNKACCPVAHRTHRRGHGQCGHPAICRLHLAQGVCRISTLSQCHSRQVCPIFASRLRVEGLNA
jgi:hypothetical protein